MSRTRVKVCGLTRLEDARLAVTLGADAIGLIFWDRSPRRVSPDQASALCETVPAFVTRVGVFVNATPDEVRAIVDRVELDAVQLHGDETLDAYQSVRAKLIKAVTLADDRAVAEAERLPGMVTPLVDAADRERRGGTGRLADWRRAARLAALRPTILAGGLTAENAARAVAEVRPWAVDVSSGVEDAPGIKSAEKLRAFFDAVRSGEGR
jgi:phosphoribosylanthranilate isomerase